MHEWLGGLEATPPGEGLGRNGGQLKVSVVSNTYIYEGFLIVLDYDLQVDVRWNLDSRSLKELKFGDTSSNL